MQGAPLFSPGGRAVNKTLWRCEQQRAGQTTNKVMFNSQDEAENFLRQMMRVEPDIFWKMEAVPASAVWN